MERDDEVEQREGYFTAQGYAWYAFPTSDDAPDSPFPKFVPNSGQNPDLDYYGPIGTAKGLVNRMRDNGYLCLTSREGAPKVLGGWEVEPAELDSTFEAHDMGTIRMVREITARQPEFRTVPSVRA